MMNNASTLAESVSERHSDQELSAIGSFGATSDEALLTGAGPMRRPPKVVEHHASPDSDSSSIPLAPWLQAILPAVREIESLVHNWDSYGSPPPPKQLVSEVLLLLHRTEFLDFPPPAFVPVSGGKVQLEWYMGRRELEVEFGSGSQAEFLATDVEVGRSYEGTFYRSDFQTMRKLVAWLMEV